MVARPALCDHHDGWRTVPRLRRLPFGSARGRNRLATDSPLGERDSNRRSHPGCNVDRGRTDRSD